MLMNAVGLCADIRGFLVGVRFAAGLSRLRLWTIQMTFRQRRASELSSKLVQYNRHSRSLNSRVLTAELPSCKTELSLRHVGLMALGRTPQLLSRQTCSSSSQNLSKVTEHPRLETMRTCQTNFDLRDDLTCESGDVWSLAGPGDCRPEPVPAAFRAFLRPTESREQRTT